MDNLVKLTSSLAKVLHYFCDGHIEFEAWAHVTGNLSLLTESGQSLNFMVDEKILRLDDKSIRIQTSSYHLPAPHYDGKNTTQTDVYDGEQKESIADIGSITPKIFGSSRSLLPNIGFKGSASYKGCPDVKGKNTQDLITESPYSRDMDFTITIKKEIPDSRSDSEEQLLSFFKPKEHSKQQFFNKGTFGFNSEKTDKSSENNNKVNNLLDLRCHKEKTRTETDVDMNPIDSQFSVASVFINENEQLQSSFHLKEHSKQQFFKKQTMGFNSEKTDESSENNKEVNNLLVSRCHKEKISTETNVDIEPIESQCLVPSVFVDKDEASGVQQNKENISDNKICSETSRFAKTTQEERVILLFETKEAYTTKRATKAAVRLFKNWLSTVGESVIFEDFSDEKLNKLLERFYCEVKTIEGKDYSRSSIVSIRSGINRHLRKPPYSRSIESKEFASSNRMMSAVLRKLKREGKDRVNHYPPISHEDLRKIQNPSSFDYDNPVELLQKVFFDLHFYLGIKGRHNIRYLKPSSFVMMTDLSGEKYVEIVDQDLKSQKAKESTFSKPRMYSNGQENCPLRSLQLYLSKLPDNCDKLFVKAKSSKAFKIYKHVTACWYTSQPIGVNNLSNIMKKISKRLNLDQIYTTHSLFATHMLTSCNQFLNTKRREFMSRYNYNSNSFNNLRNAHTFSKF